MASINTNPLFCELWRFSKEKRQVGNFCVRLRLCSIFLTPSSIPDPQSPCYYPWEWDCQEASYPGPLRGTGARLFSLRSSAKLQTLVFNRLFGGLALITWLQMRAGQMESLLPRPYTGSLCAKHLLNDISHLQSLFCLVPVHAWNELDHRSEHQEFQRAIPRR